MDKKRIFVLDDKVDFLDIIKLRLEQHNYNVAVFERGADILNRIKEDRPDAVLLDILVPVLDGLAVLKRIRQIDKDLPVFMMTAYSSNERFNSAKKLGASGFIVKTGDLNREIQNITNALRVAAQYKDLRPKRRLLGRIFAKRKKV